MAGKDGIFDQGNFRELFLIITNITDNCILGRDILSKMGLIELRGKLYYEAQVR